MFIQGQELRPNLEPGREPLKRKELSGDEIVAEKIIDDLKKVARIKNSDQRGNATSIVAKNIEQYLLDKNADVNKRLEFINLLGEKIPTEDFTTKLFFESVKEKIGFN